jgi:hypothetical protein
MSTISKQYTKRVIRAAVFALNANSTIDKRNLKPGDVMDFITEEAEYEANKRGIRFRNQIKILSDPFISRVNRSRDVTYYNIAIRHIFMETNASSPWREYQEIQGARDNYVLFTDNDGTFNIDRTFGGVFGSTVRPVALLDSTFMDNVDQYIEHLEEIYDKDEKLRLEQERLNTPAGSVIKRIKMPNGQYHLITIDYNCDGVPLSTKQFPPL